MNEAAARYFHMDVNDLQKAIISCRSATAALKGIEDEARRYWANEAKGKPEADRLRAFSNQRKARIEAGVTDLMRSLSGNGWPALRAHINGSHRLTIHQEKRSGQ